MGILTNGDEESLVGDTTNGILKTIDDDRGQDSLSRTGLASERQGRLRALEETGQVGSHPQTGVLFTLMGKVGGVLGQVAKDPVLRCEPGLDSLDNGNYSNDQ